MDKYHQKKQKLFYGIKVYSDLIRPYNIFKNAKPVFRRNQTAVKNKNLSVEKDIESATKSTH